MDLERYRVPASVLEGVEIELPGSEDARFRVALPTESNRAFIAALQRQLVRRAAPAESGPPDFSVIDSLAFRDARIEAFREQCILEMPGELTRDQLGGEFWPALAALYERANDLATDEEAGAKAAVKKSRA
jgi:hypothetical protein